MNLSTKIAIQFCLRFALLISMLLSISPTSVEACVLLQVGAMVEACVLLLIGAMVGLPTGATPSKVSAMLPTDAVLFEVSGMLPVDGACVSCVPKVRNENRRPSLSSLVTSSKVAPTFTQHCKAMTKKRM